MGGLERNELNLGAVGGSSPAETRYYFIALFDISDKRKYRILLKALRDKDSEVSFRRTCNEHAAT